MTSPPALSRVCVTRYVTPLREGGSLPGLVEADDLGTYVCKFHGAGQGVRVLVAEVIAAGLARRLSIATPDQVVMELDPAIARYEADEEVQDLLNASAGLNLGIDFLPGAFGYDLAYEPEPALAGRILWFDALIANVDRSWRNPNLLVWGGGLHAIDHGASLYFHHSWAGGIAEGASARFARQPYAVAEHVFRSYAAQAVAQSEELAARLSAQVRGEIVAAVPEEWLEPVPGAETPDDLRAQYVAFLGARLESVQAWLPSAAQEEGA